MTNSGQIHLGDIPSRLDGWVCRARARGDDTISLDLDIVDRLLAWVAQTADQLEALSNPVADHAKDWEITPVPERAAQAAEEAALGRWPKSEDRVLNNMHRGSRCDFMEGFYFAHQSDASIQAMREEIQKLREEKEALESKFRCVVSHATGGGVQDIALPLNTLSVEITRFRTRLWNDAKELGAKEARAALSTPSEVSNPEAEMAAFGASEAAGYYYPGADQQKERQAFCAGAAHAVSNPVADNIGGEASWRDAARESWETWTTAQRADFLREQSTPSTGDAVREALEAAEEMLAYWPEEPDAVSEDHAAAADGVRKQCQRALAALNHGGSQHV